MTAAVPIVEIADHADALSVGRPNGEAGSGDAINRAVLRTELVVDAAFIAFPEKVEVGFAERRQKGIRIACAMDLAGLVRDDTVVGIHPAAVLCGAFEDVAFGNAL